MKNKNNIIKHNIYFFCNTIFLILVVFIFIGFVIADTVKDVVSDKMEWVEETPWTLYPVNEYPESKTTFTLEDKNYLSGSEIKALLPQRIALYYSNPSSSRGYEAHGHHVIWSYCEASEADKNKCRNQESGKKLLEDTDQISNGNYVFTADPGEGYTVSDVWEVDYNRINYDSISESDRSLRVVIKAETPLEKLESLDPDNMTLNLFDYWLSAQEDADDSLLTNWNSLGINKNHILLFLVKSYLLDLPDGSVNYGGKLNQNIVQKKLSNGYPILNPDSLLDSDLVSGVSKDESLAYLFDPNFENDGKKSYTNVTGLFRRDEKGYYYFNCNEETATLEDGVNAATDGAKINLYNKPTIFEDDSSAQFFPFNNITDFFETNGKLKSLKQNDPVLNHFFGLTLEIPFTQAVNGEIQLSDGSK